MLAIREEELNMVNGGAFEGLFGESKFNVGDRVVSKSNPDYGIGIVVSKKYYEGWWYNVVMGGRVFFTSEADLETPIMK